MKPRGRRGLAVGVLLVGAATSLWLDLRSRSTQEVVFEPEIPPVEAAAFCPWRQPDADLARFFPGATHSKLEPVILSSFLPELTRSLGRPLLPEENPLRRHRIWKQDERLGFVLTQRLRGEHGAIEIVLAIDTTGQVQGVRFQRLREPERIAAALTNSAWLAAFQGRSVTNGWRLDDDLPRVIPEANTSAAAVADGVRGLLVLNAMADKAAIAYDHSHHSR